RFLRKRPTLGAGRVCCERNKPKTQTPFRSTCLLLERIAFALIERTNGLVVVAFLVDFHVCAEQKRLGHFFDRKADRVGRFVESAILVFSYTLSICGGE